MALPSISMHYASTGAGFHTFPDPVTPKVANNPSRPWYPGAPSTPSSMGTMPVPLNMSVWCASSSKTCVKANRSTARLRLSLTSGRTVICVGWLSRSSTVRNRGLAGLDGRRRRYTSKSALDGRGGGFMAIVGDFGGECGGVVDMAAPGSDLGNMQLMPAAAGKHCTRRGCHGNGAAHVVTPPPPHFTNSNVM